MSYREITNPVGRPRIFKTVEALQTKIDSYFKSCEGTLLLDKDNNPMLDKNSEPIITGFIPLTITGLALYIGLASRQALLNYQYKDEYYDAITRAKAKVENFAETSLYSKERVQGAKFNLSNNFGWSEKNSIETIGKVQASVLDLSKFTVDQLKEMAK